MLRGRNRILEEDVEWGAELHDVHSSPDIIMVYDLPVALNASEENAVTVFARKP